MLVLVDSESCLSIKGGQETDSWPNSGGRNLIVFFTVELFKVFNMKLGI